MHHVHISALNAFVTFLLFVVTVGASRLVAMHFADRSKFAQAWLQIV